MPFPRPRNARDGERDGATARIRHGGHKDTLVFVGDTEVDEVPKALGFRTPRPVVVLIGGAGEFDTELRRDPGLRLSLVTLLDRGLLPPAIQADAVVLTGGTDAGVMRLLGEVVGRRRLPLIGVAPAAQVRHEAAGDGDGRQRLSPDHHRFVLTPGRDWGSESEVLFGLANALTGGRRQGVVVLINGGAIARYECRRFLEAGWPVVVVGGSGRGADELAGLTSRPGWWGRARRVLGIALKPHPAWGRVWDYDIEVHELTVERPPGETADATAFAAGGAVVADDRSDRQARRTSRTSTKSGDPVALLHRRLAWRLSDESVVKSAWVTYDDFNKQAARAKRVDGWLRRGISGGSLVLVTLSLVIGAHHAPHALRWFVVTLPVLLAALSGLQETALYGRRRAVMRHAAEATLSAIWVHSVIAGVRPGEAPARLARTLAAVSQNILRDGESPAGAARRRRPSCLHEAQDEFAALTARAYLNLRIDAQIAYYSDTVSLLRVRKSLAIGATSVLAAAATGFAAEAGFELYVPILVLAASVITVVQQRARWQEVISAYNSALVDLTLVRNAARGDETGDRLREFVERSEAILRRERSTWARTMGRSLADTAQFRYLGVDTPL